MQQERRELLKGRKESRRFVGRWEGHKMMQARCCRKREEAEGGAGVWE
jgi:hypothetical protein